MKSLFSILVLAIMNPLMAQNFYQIEDEGILLDNGELNRRIVIRNDSLYSTRLSLASEDYNYIINSKDFNFILNDKEYSGYSGWKLIGSERINDPSGGNGIKLKLRESGNNSELEIEINYMLYPGLPLVRKWMKFTNIGGHDLKLESLSIEYFVSNLRTRDNVVYHDYARMKHIGRFVGNWYDPLVVIHQAGSETERRYAGSRGIALGNEVPGILKRTEYNTEKYSVLGHEKTNIEIGLTKPGQSYPFRKWLEPGESWESPKVFICLYNNRDDGYEVVNEEVNEFIVKYMKPRINTYEDKPVLIYNNWIPFYAGINADLIGELIEAAADCGYEQFIVCDGWQANDVEEQEDWQYGDWVVNREKFPDGLKPLYSKMKALGIRPGIWIAVTDATGDAKVFNEHPEWFTQGPDGNPWSLHVVGAEDRYTASLGTEWYDYIKETILGFVNEYGITYCEIDLAAVVSAYVNDDAKSGSYAKNHMYRDHNESFIVLYERLLQLYDELHEAAPDLFIDFTFETVGKFQLTDYSVVQHAEGCWLSNYREQSPVGPLRVRQIAWWRSPAIPASSLVVGNMQIDDPDYEFVIKSMIGTIPVILGDPRELSREERRRVKAWSDWISNMQDKHDYMTYRKDLPGFGQPQEGSWDGWQRINFQTGEGGIFGVFRQGAVVDTRRVILKDLKPDETYVVKRAPYGGTIHKATGKELMEEGFTVRLTEKYDADVFEVTPE